MLYFHCLLLSLSTHASSKTHPVEGHGGLEMIPADSSMSKRWSSPWSGQQFITGLTQRDNHSHAHSHPPSSIKLNVIMIVGGNLHRHMKDKIIMFLSG